MKKNFSLLAAMLALAGIASAELVTVRPLDTGAALENPGMGWVFHHYDNSIRQYGPVLGPAYDGRDFPGLTVVYLRLAWSYLEPVEGQFNWAILDTPIQRYGAVGKRFAFRFTVFESDPRAGTPDWVRAAGAQGKDTVTDGKNNWEPDYDDPIFLAKLHNFLNAAGRRYADNPSLAFVDVGTLGIWGEGHFNGTNYGLGTFRRHLELHRQAFPKALLVANDDWTYHPLGAGVSPTATMKLAREFGATFRDDSLCVYSDPKSPYSAPLAQPFWPTNPVIIEMDHYSATKKNKTWGDGSRYAQAVEDYHASYISIHGDPVLFLKENTNLIAQINRRLGYRLNLVQATFPDSMERAEGLRIESQWRNVGVAPCLPGGHPAWWLVDAQDNVCAVLVDGECNVRNLSPNATGTNSIGICQHLMVLPSGLKPGNYELRVSMGDASGTPQIALPLAGDDGHHRYRIGNIRLQ